MLLTINTYSSSATSFLVTFPGLPRGPKPSKYVVERDLSSFSFFRLKTYLGGARGQDPNAIWPFFLADDNVVVFASYKSNVHLKRSLKKSRFFYRFFPLLIKDIFFWTKDIQKISRLFKKFLVWKKFE